MHWSTISRTILHFYFNYHYGESPVTYIHSSFVRRIQFSFRAVIGFLIGGLIAYKTAINDQLSQGFLIPLISLLSIQETFGLTISVCLQMVFSLVPTSIFLFIVQKIGLGYQDYLATELILLVSSFIISFICTQNETRKTPLVLCVIFFSAIVNEPDMPSTFIFELLEVFLVGICISIVISLTIFPVFATMDIENRVNYCLLNLQEMQRLIIEGFIRQDKMNAQVLLSRSSTIEEMIRRALTPIHMKMLEARFEPSRIFQCIFNRRRRNIIDLTITEQEDLIMSWYLHICLMQLMLKEYQFNSFDKQLTEDLEENVLRLCSCQSVIICTITKYSSISKDQFLGYISDLEQAGQSLRLSYNKNCFHRVEDALISEYYLFLSFFLFQIDIIQRLITQIITTNDNKPITIKKKKSVKERLTPKWSNLFSALKSTIIIGVGSIFVMIPSLAKLFENGQWILIALCMTQGDSVGGAFTTMKMRVIGTLLGAMWGYITYLSVEDNISKTFGMLVPWILVLSYIRVSPKWNYTATVGIVTPILISLGRTPYGERLPEGNLTLLRIEENLIGIGISIILTLIIFPVFAFDSLKDNIQTTLQTCRDSINSMSLVSNQFCFEEQSTDVHLHIDKQEQDIKSSFQIQRNHIYQLILAQRTLIEDASTEPTFWCFNNSFSTSRYKALIQQQIDIFQMLYSIDTTSSHFSQTQTKLHRFLNHCICSKTKLSVLKHEEYLIELHKRIVYLEKEYDNTLKYYLDRLNEDYSLTNNLIFIPIASMYFSISELVRSTITLGITIQNIFEVETTDRYIHY